MESQSIGFVHAVPFTKETAQYVAGYTVKKLTKPEDPLLNGRYPEFMRVSNRPGLGRDCMTQLAKQLKSCGLSSVPSQIRISGRLRPLGRYLTQKLAEDLGMEKEFEEGKTAWLSEYDEEVQRMLEVKKRDAPLAPWTRKQAYLSENQGRIWSVETRTEIFKKRVTI